MRYSLYSIPSNDYFNHRIQIDSMLDFHSARVWLTATYGYSSALEDTPANKHWAFQIDYQNYMLYLLGDEELAWFKIRYGADEHELLL